MQKAVTVAVERDFECGDLVIATKRRDAAPGALCLARRHLHEEAFEPLIRERARDLAAAGDPGPLQLQGEPNQTDSLLPLGGREADVADLLQASQVAAAVLAALGA